MKKKLKPIVFSNDRVGYYRNNKEQQDILLKTMMVTTEPSALKKAIGARMMSEVTRTLDKLAIRKDYHKALGRNGISLDYIVSNIKGIIETTGKDAVKLKALEVILRSVGLDTYEEIEKEGKSWEEMLIDLQNSERNNSKMVEAKVDEYSVDKPVEPKSEIDRKEDERNYAKELYGTN